MILKDLDSEHAETAWKQSGWALLENLTRWHDDYLKILKLLMRVLAHLMILKDLDSEHAETAWKQSGWALLENLTRWHDDYLKILKLLMLWVAVQWRSVSNARS